VNYRAIVLGALLAVGFTACDPYEDEKGGTPAVTSVVLSDGSTPTEVTAPDSSGTWAVTGEDSAQNVVFVIANKLLSGSSIQTTPTDCTPANNWLTVTTTAPEISCDAGQTPAWYTCYLPSSPVPEQGGTVAIFRACEAPNSTDGWFVLAQLSPSSTYHFTGSIQDSGGAALPIDVTVTTAAPAAP
jgi:hypothetical protein